ncbi:RHS repeat-associated core domain-containing protein [Microbulbifer discodermiae]|uniref:RHS repeat-associated core domain-containing protein n=1 Tax=Microbulbifer sp. 2201CG32-9 TaxID=3232309 RepID=UPI00345BB0DB
MGRFYYNYFRDYDPSTGRYLQSDPLGLLDGTNTFGYVQQNPTIYSDSRGLYTSYGIPDIYNTNRYNDGMANNPDPCGCTVKALGIDTLAGLGLVLGGQPTVEKRFVQRGTSAGTSPLSKGLSKAFPQKLPFRLPAPTQKRPFARSNKLGRVLGRWAPLVGWGLLAEDFVNYGDCLKECVSCQNE